MLWNDLKIDLKNKMLVSMQKRQDEKKSFVNKFEFMLTDRTFLQWLFPVKCDCV